MIVLEYGVRCGRVWSGLSKLRNLQCDAGDANVNRCPGSSTHQHPVLQTPIVSDRIQVRGEDHRRLCRSIRCDDISRQKHDPTLVRTREFSPTIVPHRYTPLRVPTDSAIEKTDAESAKAHSALAVDVDENTGGGLCGCTGHRNPQPVAELAQR